MQANGQLFGMVYLMMGFECPTGILQGGIRTTKTYTRGLVRGKDTGKHYIKK